MSEHNLIDINVVKNESLLFAHHINKKDFQEYYKNIEDKGFDNDSFLKTFRKNYDELSKNDWELHKKLIEEGVNPNELAKIIRNDEVEKLQEISSQNDFNFNKTIEPSLYERCTFINQKYVTLIDYAAFFGSIKCFKYLLLNGANVINAGKYAVASGNIEIIHLCEQNNSLFNNAYETAIEFHKNDIFNYLYENKIGKTFFMFEAIRHCILYNNYEIFSLLEEKGMEIDHNLIYTMANIGNLFLIKYFIKHTKFPSDVLISSANSGNNELVKYILEQKGIDVNVRGINSCFFNVILVGLIFWGNI